MRRFEKKAVNTVEIIKDTVQQKVETVKDSTAHAAKEAYNFIKDVHEKTESVNKDIKDGYHEVTQDIHKTVNCSGGKLNFRKEDVLDDECCVTNY